MAEFHLACTDIAAAIPAPSKTIKSDAIHLLDLLESPFATRNFALPPESIGVLWQHTHHFLERLVELGYDDWPKIPVLIDWNLGNFSVRPRPTARSDCSAGGTTTGSGSSRGCSTSTSSRGSPAAPATAPSSPTAPHTLTEPSFLAFLEAYSRRVPAERRTSRSFLPEVYRFFILNYVVREGSRFFRADLCTKFRGDAVRTYLPALDTLDVTPLLRGAR